MAFLLDTLEQEDPDAGATAVVGISKLMLSGLITDEEVRAPPLRSMRHPDDGVQILNRLVLLYFASETADNQPLRQCLSYFFPVYCYSSPINQRRMSKVCCFPSSLLALLRYFLQRLFKFEESDDSASIDLPHLVGFTERRVR